MGGRAIAPRDAATAARGPTIESTKNAYEGNL
jgi:hypothetical protein